MHLYKSWDESYYVTNKFDGSYGYIKRLKGFKGVTTLVKHVGFKAAWIALSMRSTDSLIVLSK